MPTAMPRQGQHDGDSFPEEPRTGEVKAAGCCGDSDGQVLNPVTWQVPPFSAPGGLFIPRAQAKAATCHKDRRPWGCQSKEEGQVRGTGTDAALLPLAEWVRLRAVPHLLGEGQWICHQHTLVPL